jgi:hypothetical protein
MRNMSRIRNTLRFQTPEERVLNGLLALVVIVLLTVAIAKVRDDRVEAAPEVKGVTITRPSEPAGRDRRVTTTTSAAVTTTTISPADLFAFALAMQRNAEQAPRTTTTTAAATGATTSPPPPPPPVGTPPTSTTTPTRPPTTSTSSSTTSSTSTTTSPPLQGG